MDASGERRGAAAAAPVSRKWAALENNTWVWWNVNKRGSDKRHPGFLYWYIFQRQQQTKGVEKQKGADKKDDTDAY